GFSCSLPSEVPRYAKASADFETKCSDPPPELLPLGLFVTCVTNHGARYDAVFGYTNDNPAQQIVPLGIANTFVPAPGNRGQPTTFEPGTVRNAGPREGDPKEPFPLRTRRNPRRRARARRGRGHAEEVPPPPHPPQTADRSADRSADAGAASARPGAERVRALRDLRAQE